MSEKSDAENPMRGLKVSKVTVSIGVGQSGQPLENAKLLLRKLTGRTPATTVARSRNPVFKLRKGDPIGAKVTLRRAPAVEFLKKAFECVGNRLPSRAFDKTGNFSLGIREYIDFPGVKYDPQIGMMGFDVCVTLQRAGGARVKARRRGNAEPRRSYAVRREEAMEFVSRMFGVELT